MTGLTETKPLKPSEIIGIVAATMLKETETAEVVYVEGLYQQRNNNQRWANCYDGLRDPDGSEEITLKMSWDMRKRLAQGNLVTVGGLLNRTIKDNGLVQLRLDVTRVIGQQAVGLSDTEAEKLSLLNEKARRGRKDVSRVLEHILFKDERPKVAMIVAATSVTMLEFENALKAARASIDFAVKRTSLANGASLCAILAEVDNGGYDAVAIVRGGGEEKERLDEIEVLRAVSEMKTPTIAAVGHAEERLAFKEIVDQEVDTPTALGHFFSEICERVAEEKTQSKAILVRQVAKQYEARIAELEKKLGEQERIAREWVAEKARFQEKQKFHERDMEDAQKQNTRLEEGKMEANRKLASIERDMDILQKRMGQLLDERLAASELLATKERDMGAMQKQMEEERGRMNAIAHKLKRQERIGKGLGGSLVAMAGLVIALLLLVVAK